MGVLVIRIGEPHRLTGAGVGSAKGPSDYTIETTPLPPGTRAAHWRSYFNAQLTGPLLAFHDGEKIIVTGTGAEPDWLDRVDAAIAKASEEENRDQFEDDM